MAERPKVNSDSQKELDKCEAQFQKFDEQVKSLSLDEANKAPVQEYEPQTKISTRQANRADAPYMKPARTIGCRAPFNEKFRAEWDEAKQYVRCLVENLEIIGEQIESWSKPFPGVPAEFWQLPVNTPIMIPRYLADQLERRFYHRFVMDENKHTSADGNATYYGAMAVKETRRRIDCRAVGNSFVSMGAA